MADAIPATGKRKKEKEEKVEMPEVITDEVQEFDEFQTDEKGLKYQKIIKRSTGSTLVYR